MRKLVEWVFLVAFSCTCGSAVLSCGTSPDSVFGHGMTEAGPDTSGVVIGDDAAVSTDDGGPSFFNGDGAGSGCKPKSCADQGFTCGPNGDGCGGVIDCGTCAAGQFCGGGGYSQCGGTSVTVPDSGTPTACTPATCQSLQYTCGAAGDGCGNVLDCGSCTAPQFCGGGGFNKCGGNNGLTPDGSVACTPTTCATLGYTCGPAGDGCGGQLQCGTCASPAYCGGGGFNKCGGNNGLTPDGSVACRPTSCAALGYTCGPAGDGCGGLLQCGSCTGGNICGGGGQPGKCGSNVPCVNLCPKQVQCDGGTTTTITGRVLAGVSAWTGLAPDPVPNVLVYVPNAAVTPFSAGAACRQCGADVSGSPLVSTYTDFDGTFTLTNVPAGTGLPLVIQLGRWRRQFTFNASACSTNALPADLNLPRNQGEGDIPFTAISTGHVDALECVLLKMGLDQTEFTPDNGTGRVHIYGGGPLSGTGGGHGPGATAGAGTRREAALLDTGGTFMNYDQIMLPCWGNPAVKTTAELANLITYADGGGHFFATHYSYSWLVGNGELDTVVQWAPNFNNPGLGPWTLNVSTAVPPSPPAPHTQTFAKWLNLVKALSNFGPTVPAMPNVSITNPRHDANAVLGKTVDWIDGVDPDHNNALVEHFTFDTPVAATTQCGHAIFSDFHVTSTGGANGKVFPAECDTTFTAQEKILEYMVWDLSSCVSPPPTPTCTPTTCAAQSITCGPAGDGCGNLLQCGTCVSPLTCGGGGVPGQCGAPDGGSCTPMTCVAQGIGCGPAGDGCGNQLSCGTCNPPLACGGGGVPGQCGGPDAGNCTPTTCAVQNIACGPAGDGCGNLLQCGACVAPQTCGGGGVAGQCGAPDAGSCTPTSCAAQNIACGPAGDGCGNLLQCGMCVAPLTCGGGGVSGQCGMPDGGTCTPLTCADQQLSCGPAGDGCGNLVQCGTCAPPQFCGGGGVFGQCGGIQ